MPWWQAGIAAGGAILSGKGESSANKKRSREAQKNRDFQERMSSTAVQRRAKDFEAAGFNRLLATRSAADGAAGSMPQVGNVGGAGVEGGQRSGETAKGIKQGSLVKAQTGLVMATTGKTQAETRMKEIQAVIAERGMGAGDDAGKAIGKWAAEAKLYYDGLSMPKQKEILKKWNNWKKYGGGWIGASVYDYLQRMKVSSKPKHKGND